MNAATTHPVRPSHNPIAVEPIDRSAGDAPAGDSFAAMLGRTQTPFVAVRPNVLGKDQAFARRDASKPSAREDFPQSLKQPSTRREISKPGSAEQGNRAAQAEKAAKQTRSEKSKRSENLKGDAAEESSAEIQEVREARRAEQAEEVSALVQCVFLPNSQLQPNLAQPEFVAEESESFASGENALTEAFDQTAEMVSPETAEMVSPETTELVSPETTELVSPETSGKAQSANAKTASEVKPSRAEGESSVASATDAPLKPEHLKNGKAPELAFDVESRFGNAAHADKADEANKAELATKLAESARVSELAKAAKQAEKISPARAGEVPSRVVNAAASVKPAEAMEMLSDVRGQRSFAGQADAGTPRDFSAETPRVFAADLAVQRGFSVPGVASALEVAPRAGMISKLTEDMWAAVNEFKVKGGDRVEVQLQTDAQTRMRLEILHERGVVEVRARLEGGDLMALASGWNDLQDSMAGRGVTLRQLESELPPRQQNGQPQSQPAFDAETRREAFAQARQRRLLEEEASPMHVRPSISAAAAVKVGNSAAPVRPGTRRGWESWA